MAATSLSPVASLEGASSAEELIELALRLRTPRQVEELGTHLAFFDRLGAEVVSQAEEALRTLEDFSSAGSGKPYPALYITVGYLRACRAAGQTPKKELDSQIQRFIENYGFEWYGGVPDGIHNEVRKGLKVLPPQRREAILSVENAPIELSSALDGGERALQNVARSLATVPDNTRYVPSRFSKSLKKFGTALIPYICDEYVREGAPTRFLGRVIDDICPLWREVERSASIDRAAPVLVEMLGNKEETARQGARGALKLVSEAVVLANIEGALNARGKNARVAAAGVLRDLPISEQAYGLAQTRLEKEKNSEVIEALQGVEAPSDGPSKEELEREARFEALVERIEATDGKLDEISPEEVPLVFPAFTECARRRCSARRQFFLKPLYAEFGRLFKDLSHVPVMRESVLTELEARPHTRFASIVVEHAPEMVEVLASAAAQMRLDTSMVRWLINEHPAQAVVAAIAHLDHEDDFFLKNYIQPFVATRLKDVEPKDLLIALNSRQKQRRQFAVECIAAINDPATISLLEEAAKKERSKDVRALIEETILRIQIANFDVDSIANDQDLDARLSELPTSDLPAEVDLGALPKLHFKEGAALSERATRWFVGEVLAESLDHCGETVRKVRDRLRDEDCHRMAKALIAIAGQDELGWALYMQGLLADEDQIRSVLDRLEEFAGSTKYAWSDHAIEMVTRVGSPDVVRILDDYVKSTKSNALRTRARDALSRIADAKCTSVDALVEASVGRLGFDEEGAKRFDYGTRTVVVRLRPGGELSFVDELGGTLSSMPRARKEDDEALVEAARTAVSQLKKDLKRLAKGQTRRLQDALITRRFWSVEVWRERFAKNPVMRSFAYGLVWGLYDEEDRLRKAFLLDDGEGVDQNFEGVVLEDGARIGLAHPLELADTLAQWRETLGDYQRVQPFPQLDRPVYSRAEIADLRAHLKSLGRVPYRTFSNRLSALGYELGPRQDAGLIFFSLRHVGEILIKIYHTPFSPQYTDQSEELEIEKITIHEGDNTIDLADAGALVFSEVFHDLHALYRL